MSDIVCKKCNNKLYSNEYLNDKKYLILCEIENYLFEISKQIKNINTNEHSQIQYMLRLLLEYTIRKEPMPNLEFKKKFKKIQNTIESDRELKIRLEKIQRDIDLRKIENIDNILEF